MRNNVSMVQGIISVIALLCLVAGWFNLFSPEINEMLSRKLFYLLIGLSFVLQAPYLANPNLKIPMYIAAGICTIGAFLPTDSPLAFLKTIGLLGGVIISFSSRNIGRNQ